MNILETFVRIINEVSELKTNLSMLTPEKNFIDDLGLDSLEFINFILEIEDVYNIQIDVENIDLDDIITVGKLSKFISGNSK